MRIANPLVFVLLLCVLAGIAVADVATGWALPAYLAAVMAGFGLVGLVVGMRTRGPAATRIILSMLAVACFSVHLGYAVFVGFETRNWDRLAGERASEAFGSVVSIFNGKLTDLEGRARALAGRQEIVEDLASGDRQAVFAQAEEIAASLKRAYGSGGVAIRDGAGRALGWSGDLPNYFEEAPEELPREGVDLVRSTAYYWIEANARTGGASGQAGGGGWVSLYRAIDSRYPGVLPGLFAQTLTDELARRVGREVRLSLETNGGDGGAPGIAPPDSSAVSGLLRLPDGRAVGTVWVGARSVEDERGVQFGRGLFIAAVLLVVLVCIGTVVLTAWLLGRRFSKASGRNLMIFLALLWVARLVLALLRDPLRLENLKAFTSFAYATQIPSGILRSPADLALTAGVALAGVAVAAVATIRGLRSSGLKVSGLSGVGGAPANIMAGLVAAAFACGLAVLTDLSLRAVLADSSVNPFTFSPFDFGATSLAMKAGLFSLTATGLILVAGLVAAEVAFFRRAFGAVAGSGALGRSAALAGLVLYALAGGLVLAGSEPFLLLTVTIGLAGGLVIEAALLRKLTPGLVGLAIGLALAVSLVQYPHALQDLYAKQRETVEARAARVMAGTDEWKISLLDEALAQVAADRPIRASLKEHRGRLDSEALRLWAESILSGSRVACGVHIVDGNDREVGRFSLEDVVDLAEIETSIRAARFASGPITFVAAGSMGGKDADLYVGIAPLMEDKTYLGSIILSIPYLYGDLETMAGLEPSFFEALRSDTGRAIQFGGGYSASRMSYGRIVATTARDFEVGRDLGAGEEPRWVERKTSGGVYASYLFQMGRPGEALALSFRLLNLNERAVFLMAVVLANVIAALAILLAVGLARVARLLTRRARGCPPVRFRWSFATKLALAFLMIAVVPTLILGTASNRFVQARSREVMEARAEESLNLARLALERLVGGEALRLARNPILMDELRVEPSILSMLVGAEFTAAVADTGGRVLASVGEVAIPGEMAAAVTAEGRSYNCFSAEGGLTAQSATPIRDAISPALITGCAYVTRAMDDPLAGRLSSDLVADLTFYGGSRVAASSKQEVFISEIMSRSMSADAYTDCMLRGRELHFTWERIGNVDLVVGHSPLRGFDGRPVGAISVPLVFRKDEVGQRMEWTSMALSYLMAVVIGSIFVLGFLLARRMARPIGALIRGTLRVSSGDLGFTIPKPSDDEIGDLVTSFNSMTAALDKSRNALTERKRYIETIIGNVGAGIISTDRRGTIDTFNAAAEALLGVRGRDARGREARGVMRRIGAANLASLLDDLGSGPGIARREVTLVRGDGAQVTLRAVGSVVRGPRQRVMGKVIVFEDVTELIRSKKLVAWSEMARQVAHEIKNPLTPMKLSAQQILQAHADRAEDFDVILEQSLSTIIEEIEALRKIAVEFSQFSRMPERRLAAIDINDVVAECLAQYERTVGESVEIVKELGADLPRPVVDRDELKRVFVNIVENAVQAMPGGGRLVVRSVWGTPSERGGVRADAPGSAHRFSVTSRPAYAIKIRNFVEVSFTDTGTGISAENSRRLFEPNFSTKTHGTGLGLAISKGTVDACGGEIIIESGEGTGTCVWVRLPAEARPTRPRHHQRRDNRKRRRPGRG
jgi:PAS domain S-box-containing protein